MPRLTDHLSNSTPAVATEATMIRNGVYTVSGNGSAFTYKVHTITQARTADLVGKRVVSRLMSNGGYQAFGFLTISGELRMWTRFETDTDAPYANLCRILLSYLPTIHVRYLAQGYGNTTDGGLDSEYWYDINWQLLCRVCNGALRDLDDMTAGVHHNGVCTTDLSPSQLRDADARAEREREAQRVMERNARNLAEAAEMRRNGSGTFADMPDAIVARLPRSEISSRTIQ